MQIAMYVHQFDQLMERTLGEVIETFRAGGMAEARAKSHQWLTWIGTPRASGDYDHAPHAIKGLEDVERIRAAFAAAEMGFVPWCVPMGLDPEREAELGAQVANVCGALELDVEPYEAFWPALAHGEYGAVEPYFARLRERAPEARLVLNIPARATPWEWGRLEQVVMLARAYVDEVTVQSYFGVPQAEEAEARVAAVAQRPVRHLASARTLAEMLDWACQRAQEWLGVWRAADMTPALYARLPKGDQRSATGQAPDVTWMEPGFAALARALGPAMGEPLAAPEADAQGNVWQRGRLGMALWVKRSNTNHWLAGAA